MSQMRSITCGLPFAKNTKGENTSLSIGLRITAIILGIIATVLGILIFVGSPGLEHLNTAYGWSLLTVSVILILSGISIKYVKKQVNDKTKEKTSSDTVLPIGDKKEIPRTSELIHSNPSVVSLDTSSPASSHLALGTPSIDSSSTGILASSSSEDSAVVLTPLSTVKKDAIAAASNQVSRREVEDLIADIDTTQIKGIATALVADVMDRLWIDIRVTDTPRHIVQSGPSDIGRETVMACAKVYDPNSKLMKILLPICIERITKSFSVPADFVKNGIVFDFLKSDKTGLLDHIKDVTLQKKILEGMRGCSTFYVTLKAELGKTLKLKIEHYKDGEWIASHTASIEYLVESTAKCVI